MPRAGLVTIALVIFASMVHAEPMDLNNPLPRWVFVAFEISPPDRPGQLDSVYTRKLPAWFAPAEQGGQVSVRMPGELVESELMAGFDAIEGTFEDFTWTFEAATGEVLTAETAGVVARTLAWGPFESSVQPSIRVHLDTLSAAGYSPPKRLFGNEMFAFCGASSDSCQSVSPVRYDRHTGYVNAVGVLRIHWGGLDWESFAPLGEAVFSEAPGSLNAILQTASESAAP